MSETITAPTEEQLQTRYSALCKMIGSHPKKDEVHKHIASHLRAITDGIHCNIGMYKLSAEITPGVKYATFSNLASAISTGDWAALGKLAEGSKTVEPTETPEAAPKPAAANNGTLAVRYQALLKVIAKLGGPDAPSRINAYIATLSPDAAHASLQAYHDDGGVTSLSKFATYNLIAEALGLITGDGPPRFGDAKWDLLKPKTNEPEPEPAVTPGRADPLEDNKILPPPRVVLPTTRPKSKPSPAGIDLASIIAQAIEQHLHFTYPVAPADVDEGKVRLIVTEEIEKLDIHEQVKAANLNGAFPTERVNALIQDAVAGLATRVILVKPDGSTKDVGRQHYKFPLLMAALSMRLNVALVGPAGSSKTTAAHNAATALELPFEAISVGGMTSKSDLLGLLDAHGQYHDTGTVRMAVSGGIMLWDEFDAANANAATYGNMLLANDRFGTPGGMKEKHKDFCLIAGLNTYGMGANRVYVGRNQLDGATLDRFAVIDWDYDEGLEASFVGAQNFRSPTLDMQAGGSMDATEWMEYVVRVRKAAENLAIRHVVSPRATIHGTKLFTAGVGRTHVESMVLWKGLEQATVDKIKGVL